MWFEWRTAVSGPVAKSVNLVADFDEWHADPMLMTNSGHFELLRMVPTASFTFVFEVDNVYRAAMDQLYRKRLTVTRFTLCGSVPCHTSLR